jgi:ribose transport system substrate-binding protein
MHENEDKVAQEVIEDHSVSRRDFLKIAGIAGAVVGAGAGLGGLLAACSSGTTTTTAAAATTTTMAAATTTTMAAGGSAAAPTGATTGNAQMGGVGFGYKGIPRTQLFNPAEMPMSEAGKWTKAGPYVVAFSNASISNTWRVDMLNEIKYHAYLHKDQITKLLLTDANDDASKQVSDIQDLLSQKPDVLIVSAAQSAALDPIISQSTQQGVPIIMVDRRVDSDNFITFVSASDRSLGRVMMAWLCEKLGGTGNIIMFPGLAGASPAELRIAGGKEVLPQFPGIKLLDMQYTDWSPTKGKQVASAMIQKYGKDIQGCWIDSSLQGSGILEAFVDAGWKDEEIPPQTGGDTNRHAQLIVQHKVPACWVNFPPLMGGVAVDVALQVLAGAAVPHIYEITTDIVCTKADLTKSVTAPDYYMEDYAQMNASGDLSLSLDIPNYDPATWKIDYPGA